jgi:hypothetical protein
LPLVVRYKFDRPEIQTLYLADLSFVLKDYETAASMYRLVRDDFKADKSTLHYAHVTLMMAACLVLDQSSKPSAKDIHSLLDTLSSILTTSAIEPIQVHAYFALIMADIYAMTRAPVDAAQSLILASNALSRSMPLLSALLTEKTSQYFLQAGQSRKLAFNQVLTAHKFLSIGGKASKHATACFAAAAVLFENTPWGNVKVKLFKTLVYNPCTIIISCKRLSLNRTPVLFTTQLNEYKKGSVEGAKRSLLLLFHVLDEVLKSTYGGGGVGLASGGAAAEAQLVLQEVLGGTEDWHSSLGVDAHALHTHHVVLEKNWQNCSVRNILVGDLPVSLRERTPAEILADNCELPHSVIEGLCRFNLH